MDPIAVFCHPDVSCEALRRVVHETKQIPQTRFGKHCVLGMEVHRLVSPSRSCLCLLGNLVHSQVRAMGRDREYLPAACLFAPSAILHSLKRMARVPLAVAPQDYSQPEA